MLELAGRLLYKGFLRIVLLFPLFFVIAVQRYRSSDAYWEDIALLKERIAPYVDAESIRYLRFPGGSTNTVSRRYGGKGLMKQLKAEVEQKGWHWVDWNVCAEDAVGGHPSAGTIYRNVVHETGQQTNCIVSDARFFLHTHHRRSTAGHYPVVCRQRLHLFDRCRGSAAELSRLARLQPVFKAAAQQHPRRLPVPPARASLHRRSTTHPAAMMAAKVHAGRQHDTQRRAAAVPAGTAARCSAVPGWTASQQISSRYLPGLR